MKYLLLLFGVFIQQVYGQVPCGDNSTYCPSGSTCCPLDSNTRYGCCPIPSAVCCSDHLHCCPSGMTCDTAHAQCTNGRVRLPMHKKTAGHESEAEANNASAEKSISRKVGVPLSASRRECSNGDVCHGESTCCYDQSNHEAYCCPTLNAKCCVGGRQCCPRGFSCSAYGDQCVREKHGVSISMQMFDTKLANGSPDEHQNKWTTCPDNSRCARGNTCCKTDKNSYRCCSLTNAKCCGMFCCPNTYSCSSNGQCEKTKSSYDFLDFLYN